MRRFTTTGMSLVVCGFLVTAVSGQVHATATNHYLSFNGNMCQSSDPAILRNVFGVYNASATTDITVECPMPRDFNVAVPQAALINMSAVVYDRNTTLNITCTLRGTTYDFGVFTNYVAFSSAGGGPGTGSQSIGNSFGPLSTSDVLFLECTLPRAQSGNVSHIQSYTLLFQQQPGQ